MSRHGKVSKNSVVVARKNPPLPHITQGYVQLKFLIGRMVQDSYNQLQMLVEVLADGNDTEGQKKARMVEYMLERRRQFIKVLVLTMWARNAQAVSEVIDLKVYLDSRQEIFQRVVWNLYEVRRKMTYARVPNPDLDTAVRVLSTGRADTWLTKGYVPPKPLTATDMVRILRNINTLLAIRFGLHEKLPPHFRDYTICSGRATFTVADEFEVDMSIGDENPASQLYLIDFRFMFEPSERSLPKGRFEREIEARANAILKASGLEGIYNFLHEFVMMKKICTLALQFRPLISGRWTENLMIDQQRRTLLVQYWPNRIAGGKSWIEVGIRRATATKPSQIGVRWMRDGKVVSDQEVPINVAVLSAENLVKTVIAMHTKYILTSIRDRLANSPVFPLSSMTLSIHPIESFDSSLKLQITPSRPLSIMVEPITGRFALRPMTPMAAQVEAGMNSSTVGIDDLIVRLKFLSTQEEIEKRAGSMGWEILKVLHIRREELKTYFPTTTKYMTFLRKKAWDKQWVVAMVLADSGESWWVAKVHEAKSHWSMSLAVRIPVTGPLNATYAFLGILERMAVAIVTLYVHQVALAQKGVLHKLQPSKVANPKFTIPDLYIRFSSLTKEQWAVDVLKLSFQGLAADGHCKLVVLGRTKEPMTQQLGSTNMSAADSDVSFHPQSGSFAVRFTVAVGETIVEPLVEKLIRIQRLIRLVAIIRKFLLPCLTVSLSRITFRYSREQTSTADVSFSGEREMKLHLPLHSPHLRIKRFLENTLNVDGLERVIMALKVTLPLLTAFDSVEALVRGRGDGVIFVLPRAIDWFRVEYRRIGVVLDWRLKLRKSVLYWFVQDPVSGSLEAEGNVRGCEGRRKAHELAGIWDGVVQGQWVPLKCGAAAELPVVATLALRIHELLCPPGR